MVRSGYDTKWLLYKTSVILTISFIGFINIKKEQGFTGAALVTNIQLFCLYYFHTFGKEMMTNTSFGNFMKIIRFGYHVQPK